MEELSTFQHRTLTGIRWTARVFSLLIILFVGIFLIADLISGSSPDTRPLVAKDYIKLTLLIITLIALGLSWKWELAGGSSTIGLMIIQAFIEPKTLDSPLLIIPLAGLLFAVCGWFSKPHRFEKLFFRSMAGDTPE